MDHNGFQGIGRLVRDPQFFTAGQRGHEHCTGTLAINRVVPSSDGPEADYVPFSIWGPRSREFCEERAKGDTVMLRGRLRTSLVAGPDGKKTSYWEIRVDDFQFGHRSLKNMQPKPVRDATTAAVKQLTTEFGS